mgnify:CR=1 FL=1
MLEKIRQILWFVILECLIVQTHDFELNTFLDVNPMELTKYLCYVITFFDLLYKPRSSILDTLYTG